MCTVCELLEILEGSHSPVFPEPMHAAAHEVIHQVVGGGHTPKHLADPLSFLRLWQVFIPCVGV